MIQTGIRSTCVFVALMWLAISMDSVRAQTVDLLENGLSNWVNAKGETINNDKWQIEDGILSLTSGGGGDLFLNEQIGDFELTFEWRGATNGNSGIKYRVQQYGNSWLGLEYQLQDDASNPVDKHTTASIYDIYPPSASARPVAVGEWNTSRIVLRANHTEHWLNGQMVASATIGSPDWLNHVAKSKFQGHPYWGQNRFGRLMLQDHGTEISFRNMKLTKLPQTELMEIAGDSLAPDYVSNSSFPVHDQPEPWQVAPPIASTTAPCQSANTCETLRPARYQRRCIFGRRR
ncbi:MAG: DUF1080 domain-containing protein [Pirellulaceae bacterium]